MIQHTSIKRLTLRMILRVYQMNVAWFHNLYMEAMQKYKKIYNYPKYAAIFF